MVGPVLHMAMFFTFPDRAGFTQKADGLLASHRGMVDDSSVARAIKAPSWPST
jgi:hypothetical protein